MRLNLLCFPNFQVLLTKRASGDNTWETKYYKDIVIYAEIEVRKDRLRPCLLIPA